MLKTKETIRDWILEYKKNHSNLSERALSKKIKYCRPCIKKLIEMDYLESRIDIGLLKKCLYNIKSESIVDELIFSDHDMTENYNLNYGYEKSIEKKIRPIEEILNFIFENKERNMCYMLAAMLNGTSIDETRSYFGDSGVLALLQLEEENIVKKDKNNRYILSFYEYTDEETNDCQCLDRPRTKNCLINVANHINPYRVGTDVSYVGIEFQRLSRYGLKEVKNILSKSHKEIRNVINKPESKGDLPSFTAFFVDTFETNIKPEESK